MGNGASALTKLQSGEIARRIREEYEACVAQGVPDDVIQQKLQARYTQALTEVQQAPLKIITSHAKLNRGISKDERQINRATKGKANLKKQGSQRRKSFDSLSKIPSSGDIQPAPIVEEKMSEKKEEPEVKVAVDTWDSVNQQPSCMICGMVFTSMAKLERHNKYSDLHAKNLKKLSEPKSETTETTTPLRAPEEAGARCRVLYTGSKFFWRTQDTFDLHIYLHIDPHCVEIIPYNCETAIELPRIYLDEEALVKCIGEEEIMGKVAERKKNATSKRFAEVLPPDSILIDEARRLSMSSHILSRLQLSKDNADPLTKTLYYDTSEDGEIVSPLLPSQPASVTPVYVPRRRHSSGEEINKKIRDLNVIQADIRQMTKDAEMIANLVGKGVQSLQNNLNKRQLMSQYSLPRQRWIKAINRVIRINAVAVNTKMLRKRFGDRYV